MREIRRALGDATRMPQFVETVHGRGYRFIAPVRDASEDPRVRGASAAPRGRPTDTERAHDHDLVGRETEWAQLSEWYAAVEQGTRRVGFLSGEAGIGKTTLVDAFLDALVARGAV
jgi:predicted ATPase